MVWRAASRSAARRRAASIWAGVIGAITRPGTTVAGLGSATFVAPFPDRSSPRGVALRETTAACPRSARCFFATGSSKGCWAVRLSLASVVTSSRARSPTVTTTAVVTHTRRTVTRGRVVLKELPPRRRRCSVCRPDMPGSVSAARRGDDSTPRLASLYPQEVQKERHFRPDIQGLRALAVLLVIVAHAGFSTFAGGFVGVDVFFVISGFLITSLLVREAARSGRISLIGFYARRARRILPAAALVAIATVVASIAFLPLVRAVEVIKDSDLGRRVRGQHPLRLRRHRLLRPGRSRRPRCSTTGRCRWRSSSTSSGRCCWSAGSPGRPAAGRPAQPDAGARARRGAEPGVVLLVAVGDVRVAGPRRTSRP